MKKTVALILALLMISVLFVSCNKQGNGGDTTPAPGSLDAAPNTTKAPESTKKPDATKAPGTTAEPTTEKPEVPVPTIADGLMVYHQDFDSLPDITDSNEVASKLGWQIRNKKMDNGDGALTDNTAIYTIEDGKLKIVNYDNGNKTDGKDSYFKMLDDFFMKPAAKGNYTVQYDVTYLAASKPDRYVVLLTNYNGFDSYNSCHIRAQGSGNNQNRFLGSWSNYDIKGPYYAGTTAESDEASSIAKKVFGQDIDTSVGVMYNKSVTIRIQCNYAEGPSCYMRDNSVPGSDFVLVSKPDSTANGFQYWNMIDNYAICLKVGGKIDSYVDNISIWSGLGNEPLDTSDTAYKAAIADYLKQVEAQQ